jgi:hypothetical protein
VDLVAVCALGSIAKDTLHLLEIIGRALYLLLLIIPPAVMNSD